MSGIPTADPGGNLWAISGRVVTMDRNDAVLDEAVLYIDSQDIVDIRPLGSPAPAEFAEVPVVDSAGTLYPGLIELHNHLPYNVLRTWQVPRRFDRRDQWGRHEEKFRFITAPMRVMGETEGLIEAVIRYVECKALVAGTTTSQGITLFSAPGSQRFYRGIVRNVEQTFDSNRLPRARAKISDVDPGNIESFFERLRESSCFLLHLSEGVDENARRHFQSLQLPDGQWAITRQLAGIHSLGLSSDDHSIYGERDGAIVWSPLSNLLLYGATLDLSSVHENSIRLGLGSDWSPTGSKNLFGEMKAAMVVSGLQGDEFSSKDVLAMATRSAADILGWGDSLGTLEPGKLADFFVLQGVDGDPYESLLSAAESQIKLVVIDGVPRFGTEAMMSEFGATTESITIGGDTRALNLAQAEADPMVGALTLSQARQRLEDGFAQIGRLGNVVSSRMLAESAGAESAGREAAVDQPRWKILLDNDQLRESRSLSTPGGPLRGMASTAVEIRNATESAEGLIGLDSLVVADDPTFFSRLQEQQNLPSGFVDALATYYSSTDVEPNQPKVNRMSISFDRFLDNSAKGKPIDQVLEASPSALSGVTEADADRLQEAFGIQSISELGTNRFFEIARSMVRSVESQFDAGPPTEFEQLFARAPDLGAMNPDRFREEFGPVMYRGRLDGSARLLLVGQDPSTDEQLARRAFVGFSGQRVQRLMQKIGLDRSYVMVNTFHFGIHGQYDTEMKQISKSDPLLGFRNELLSALDAANDFQVVVAVGAAAREAIELWPGAASHSVFELVHPSAPVSLVLPNWNASLAGLSDAVRAEVESDLTAYGDNWRPDDAIDIPRFDLPYGIPTWHGSGGQTRSHREGNTTIKWNSSESD